MLSPEEMYLLGLFSGVAIVCLVAGSSEAWQRYKRRKNRAKYFVGHCEWCPFYNKELKKCERNGEKYYE